MIMTKITIKLTWWQRWWCGGDKKDNLRKSIVLIKATIMLVEAPKFIVMMSKYGRKAPELRLCRLDSRASLEVGSINVWVPWVVCERYYYSRKSDFRRTFAPPQPRKVRIWGVIRFVRNTCSLLTRSRAPLHKSTFLRISQDLFRVVTFSIRQFC